MVMAEKKKEKEERKVHLLKVQKQMGFKNISGMAAAKGDESTDFRSLWSFQR